jgi:diguanylate cyclase (GGDEF)-like protein/PAS domain S-box-containing protein
MGSLTAWKPEGKHFEFCAETGVKTTSLKQAEFPTIRDLSEEAELGLSAARAALGLLGGAMEAVPEGLALFDADDRYIFWNEKYAGIYGEGPNHDFRGLRFEDMAQSLRARGRFSDALGCAESWIQGRLARRLGQINNYEQLMSDGRWIKVAERQLTAGGYIGVHVDITELKRREASFQLLLESNPIPMWVHDRETDRCLAVNAAAIEHYGYSREQFFAMPMLQILLPEDRQFFRDIAAELDRLEHRTKTWRHLKADGTEIDVSIYCQTLQYEGHEALLIGVFDTTERRRTEERIAFLAHHDALTGLPNRLAFNERLATALGGGAATGQPFAILCLDLDRLKEANDAFGHAVGDDLLREVSKCFASVIDGGFLARVGGDEFTAIVSVGVATKVVELASRLLNSINHVFQIGGRQIKIGASAGIAIFPTDGPAESILAKADSALYRAKGDGRGTVRLFDADLDGKLRERQALLQDLHVALERGELSLHYQPQADANGVIFGFEALLRWIHPTRGFVPPDAFIPLAEESGLILPIGEWVLGEACREAATWPRALGIAVNISPVQFQQGQLVDRVRSILIETGMGAARLELEVTEGVLIDDFSAATRLLHQLKGLGLRIAMDDFGTGFSSLRYLQSFPFDKIKIDRSFISDLESNPQSEAIVRAIIGLGTGLGTPVIAEGVETKEQLAFLTKEGCLESQGYLIGRPQPIAAYAQAVGRETPQSEVAASAPPGASAPTTPREDNIAEPRLVTMSELTSAANAPLYASSYDFESASKRAVKFLHENFGFDLWMVTRVENDNWTVLSADDHGYGVKAGTVFKWSDSFCSRMIQGLGPSIAPDVSLVPAYLDAPIGRQVKIGAYVGVPLYKRDGKLFGTLCAIQPEKINAERMNGLAVVHMIADMLSCVLNGELRLLDSQRATERALIEATKDPLTGLFNRRGWLQFLEHEEARCRRYGHPACVISIDLDDLKSTNDEMGHAHGDQLIQRAANAMSSSVRSSDIVARTGGDEFLILGVECDSNQGQAIVDRLERNFVLNNVRASIGLTDRTPEAGLDGTCHLADQEMYRQKALRKNRRC